MKRARVVAAVFTAVSLTAAAPAASARHHAKARAPQVPAASQSFEARYQACRTAAFRKFGWHYGPRLVLYADFAVEQVDFCVRNGGHL